MRLEHEERVFRDALRACVISSDASDESQDSVDIYDSRITSALDEVVKTLLMNQYDVNINKQYATLSLLTKQLLDSKQR